MTIYQNNYLFPFDSLWENLENPKIKNSFILFSNIFWRIKAKYCEMFIKINEGTTTWHFWIWSLFFFSSISLFWNCFWFNPLSLICLKYFYSEISKLLFSWKALKNFLKSNLLFKTRVFKDSYFPIRIKLAFLSKFCRRVKNLFLRILPVGLKIWLILWKNSFWKILLFILISFRMKFRSDLFLIARNPELNISKYWFLTMNMILLIFDLINLCLFIIISFNTLIAKFCRFL